MPRAKKHSKQKIQAKYQQQGILGAIWSYTKTIAGYISLTNLVKILAISTATSHMTGALASQCQTRMQLPINCEFPVIHPGSPGTDEYVSSIIPEKNFTTAQILCKFTTDYPGAGGVDFDLNTPNPMRACKLEEDGSCTQHFDPLVKKGETLSVIIPSIATDGRRRAPTIETLFPGCDYHEPECASTASSLYISCVPN